MAKKELKLHAVVSPTETVVVSAYDENGNQTAWRGYRKGEYSFCWIYTYDGEGNQVLTERFDADGERILSSRKEYDGSSHILYSYGLNDEEEYEVEAAYQWSDDFHTRKSPWYHYNNGQLAGYDVYTYDDYGNLLSLRTESTDQSEPVRERKYIYD